VAHSQSRLPRISVLRIKPLFISLSPFSLSTTRQSHLDVSGACFRAVDARQSCAETIETLGSPQPSSWPLVFFDSGVPLIVRRH
jgi:hypothetical protein